MKKIKYTALFLLFISFMSCDNDTLEDLRERGQEESIELEAFTQGSADFSKYVSMGNSLTAGFADGALYKIAQENSMPAILAQQFAALGNGGTFTQPLMNDNVGGLLAGGTQIQGFGPRLVLDLSGPRPAPVPLQSLVPSAVPTTDIVLNNPTGPFNNLGVPGAKSFHLLAPGYGNIGALPNANPYFVRMTGTSPDASVIELAIAQQPSFVSLWIGNNDVLGYALSGGDGTNPITPLAGDIGVGFEATYQALIGSLTTNISGVQGILGNIPNVTAIPHFTTVPHNPVPLDAATAGAVNQAYMEYNGGLQLALANSLITAEEANARTINFEASSSNAVVIVDEDLTDLSGLGLPNFRQATEEDLLVLPASSFIGTLADPQNPLSVNGVAIPLSDKWVLTPEEQNEIKTATMAFNNVIETAAAASGFALFDANTLLDRVASTGVETNGLVITSTLATGGAFSLDGVHPTSRGYALVANEMLKAIDATYGSNFEASGNLVDVSTFSTTYSASLLE
ncbi:G-D-S-L family lipolytic protein [Aquimarina algicola]|uniref:G-D-S-L family lipolytic protein n=1 Tax=Aquimarina algicola TaxID=2589995 RepID=A0A504JLV6_9FLAO|nr:G-D-S-L family lipolytic protein [Aquimarina algicola]TPN87611.1 G-D-S-L family lipolytic protein [Aquimarina algicola]